MDSIKSKVFNYLTQAQKSDFCHYLASFVKKHYKRPTSEIANMLIEDEKHYLLIQSSRFPWLEEYLENDDFLKDIELYIKENQKKCEYAEKQRPYYEKQKAYAKEQRKLAQERKMAKMPPTKAQLAFYTKLCKKYGLESTIDPETASRLDLKKAIGDILDKPHRSE